MRLVSASITCTVLSRGFSTKAKRPPGAKRITVTPGRAAMRAATARRRPSIATIVPSCSSATKAAAASGDQAMAVGREPVRRSATFVIRRASITDTVPAPALVTKTRAPSALKARSCGPFPVAIRASTRGSFGSCGTRAAVASITATSAASSAASTTAQRRAPSGCRPSRVGRRPAATCAATFQVPVSITATRSAPGWETKRCRRSAASAQSSPGESSGIEVRSLEPPKPNSGSTTLIEASSSSART